MQNKLTIRNFRVFSDEGATFEFKPITILTGANGAGKSSLAKAVMLMQGFFSQGIQDQLDNRRSFFEPSQYKLDFTDPSLKFGGFSSELNRKSNCREMVFSYSYASNLAPLKECTVEYHFQEKEGDRFNNGWISQVVCKYGDDVVMKASMREGKTNLNVDYFNVDTDLLFAFQRFIIIANILDMQNLRSYYDDPEGDFYNKKESDRIRNEQKRWADVLKKYFGSLDAKEERGANYFLKSEDSNPNLWREKPNVYPILFDDCLLKAIETLQETGILFYFPVLDQLKDLSKDDACLALKNAELQFNYYDFYDELREEIISTFKSSSFESFLDFYRNLEKKYMSDIVSNSMLSFDPLSLDLIKNDLIERVMGKASLSFSPDSDLGGIVGRTNFNKLYSFLSNWQWHETPSNDDFYVKREINSGGFSSSSHQLYSAYKKYLEILLREVLLPKAFSNIKYIGNAHTGMKRLYSFEDKDDLFMNRIEEYLDAVREYEGIKGKPLFGVEPPIESFKPGDFINKWIKELGFGHSFYYEIDKDSLGVKLFLRKEEGDERGISLADEGYGVNQTIALLICLETAILSIKLKEWERSRYDFSSNKNSKIVPMTIIIEEPEVNLHPAIQSRLAEIFYSAATWFENNLIQFIIETHSEYLIRKTQILVAGEKYASDEDLEEKCKFKVYYFPKDGVPYDMGYTRSGRFLRKYGAGFFDAASLLNLELMKMERNQ